MSTWRRIVSEAHRRSLWQVLGIYMMGSWIGYEVVLGLVEGVGLPSWFPAVVLALFVIGLPVVLATAFVQEGLPGTSERASATLDPVLFPDAREHTDTPTHNAVHETPQATRSRSRLTSLLTWRRAVTAGVAMFAMLGLATAMWLVLRAAGVGPMASLLAAAEIEANDRVLIAEFEARGADSTLAAVVTDAYRIDFSRSTLVRSVTPAEVRQALDRMEISGMPRLDAELVRQIAVREGISAYVTGEVSAAGGGYIVSVRLIATESGDVLAAMRERARTEDDLIDAVDRLSVALRERTGESLRTIRRAEPLAKVTTSSLEALQYYTQAHRASNWEGDPERSRELYERAIQLDTAFAAAHRALSISLYNDGDMERSIALAERALLFADRLSAVELATTRSSLHLSRGEFAAAATELERSIALEPAQYAALNNLGLVYDAMGDRERAEEYYRRSVQVDPKRFFAYVNLGEHLVTRGRFDEAEEAFRAAVERAPQSAWAVGSLAIVPYVKGNVAEAETRLRRVLADPASTRGVQERGAWMLYNLLRAQGRFAEAYSFVEAQQSAMADPDVDVAITLEKIIDDVMVFARPDAARRRLPAMHTAAARVDGTSLVAAAEACAWAGDVVCARDYIERAGQSAWLRPWSSLEVRIAHAALALAEGEHARAITVLREMRIASCHACDALMLGRVYMELNQPDSAAVQFERHIAQPVIDRVQADFILPLLHEWLGGYYENRNTAVAAQHYSRMIQLWQNADAELQPRIAAARRRLASLSPDG